MSCVVCKIKNIVEIENMGTLIQFHQVVGLSYVEVFSGSFHPCWSGFTVRPNQQSTERRNKPRQIHFVIDFVFQGLLNSHGGSGESQKGTCPTFSFRHLVDKCKSEKKQVQKICSL